MTPQYLGNKALLNKKLTAFFASRTVQTARVMACYDWATSLSAETDCVVSGFQSAIERDVLHFLLKKKIPIVVVLARAIYKHIPEELREAYDNGNLLFISERKYCPVTIESAEKTAFATNGPIDADFRSACPVILLLVPACTTFALRKPSPCLAC